MVIAAPEPKAETQPAIGERRVTLHGISWKLTYLQILAIAGRLEVANSRRSTESQNLKQR